MLAPHARLGQYEIVALIGKGGMGEVYRARDTKLRREVAIKTMPAGVRDDPELRMRFDREARALAALNHPNVATLYGVEESADATALVMELVDGPTLSERLVAAGGSLSLGDALAIGRQMAEALEAAHEHGIVHRDLKPANVKITSAGIVKLLDFGLAKAAVDDTGPHAGHLTRPAAVAETETQPGVILGTAAYMSPEQVRGLAIDRRADIWAFGCVLYEMLTGCPAFAAPTVSDTFVNVLEHAPDWSRLPPATPPALRRLLRRCLEKESRTRLRDIGDARLEIDEVRADPGVAAATRVSGPRERALQRLTDFCGLKESPAVSPDGKMVAFVALVGGRRQIWIRMLAGGAPLQVTHDDSDHEHPRWAPDSSTLIYYTRPASARGVGTIWEISALGGPPRRISESTSDGDISHDGRRLAVFQPAADCVALMALARDGSQAQLLVRLPPEHLCRLPRWSPDDRFIAFQSHTVDAFNMRLHVAAAETGDCQEIVANEWVRGFSWLPDGSGLVYSSSRGSTLLYPPVGNLRTIARDGSRNEQLTFGDVSITEPDLHASGRLIATRTRSDSDIWKFPTSGSAEANTRGAVRVTRQTGHVQTPSVSPDGTELVYLSDNGGHGNLWVAKTNGSGIRQITFEQDPAVRLGVPMWSPAGDWIAFIVARAGRTALWLVRPDGSAARELVSPGWGACWSHDGRWL